jgi:hypothetical protein
MTSALGFPSAPILNQQYTVGSKLYSWSGTTWTIISTPSSGGLTQEEVQDFAAPLLNHSSHTNITASYDDAANKILLTGSTGGSSLTQEEIQDFVAPLLNHSSHSNITASYNDVQNKIILSSSGGGGGGTDIGLLIALS